MIKVNLSSICLLCFVLIVACGDKENLNETESLTRLTNNNYKDWLLQKVTYVLVEVTGQIPECQRDEIYRFYADGRGEIRSGHTPCDFPEPQVQTTGTWQFTDNAGNIKVVWSNGQSWDANINKLEHGELVVDGTILENYQVTATFKPY